MKIKSVLCFLSSANLLFAFGLGDIMNTVQNIQKTLPINNANANQGQSRSIGLSNASASSNSSTQQQIIKDASCKNMFEHSPKESVVGETAKYVVGGALAGALAGALLDKKNRGQGAVIGAIAGMMAGVGASYLANQEKLRTSPEDLAKKINYDYKAPYFRFEKIIIDGSTFKPGQFIPLVFRFDILEPQKDDSALVAYYATLYRNNVPVSSFYDYINLPQGGVADVMAIPVCKNAIPGKYTLYIRSVSLGNEDVKEVSWNVQ